MWDELVNQLLGAEYRVGLVTPESPVHRVEFDHGLTDFEVAGIESRFGFRFPPDLREFLQTAIPRGPHFPDWRSNDEGVLREWLDRPRRGILFDVEHNGYWVDDWGMRPDVLGDALRIATQRIVAAPRLIAVFAHRMIPNEPHLPGNPVFSVHQTDVIYYGYDLADYLRHEFNLNGRHPWPACVRHIRFWGDIAS
jgi:hypothetical protein